MFPKPMPTNCNVFRAWSEMGMIGKSEGAIVVFKNGGVSANKEMVGGF